VITKFDPNLEQVWSILFEFLMYEDGLTLSSTEDFLYAGGDRFTFSDNDIVIIQIDTSDGSTIKTFTK